MDFEHEADKLAVLIDRAFLLLNQQPGEAWREALSKHIWFAGLEKSSGRYHSYHTPYR